MPRLLTTTLIAPIAVAALSLSLSGCGGSQSSSTSSASSASSTTSVSATTSASAAATAQAGTLAAACSQIDAVMGNNPDADPAGTAKKLEDIKAEVTTPDADIIEALVVAYTAIAQNPAGSADDVYNSSKALGAACESATTAPKPN
ncbi:hypothetical protein [Mycobacterium sp. DL592]|uniref:hypothetical protein n=1 Tax=Mycobacterium sp. DL592 TaxID=2675524 RepID=UPI00141FACFF|nr:hypothetical protein [Mycobacterium sp. DL592]